MDSLDSSADGGDGHISVGLVGAFIGRSGGWNITQTIVSKLWSALAVKPGPCEVELSRLLGQHQQWFLFDVPSREDYWFVSVGHCVDGSRIDVFGSVFASTSKTAGANDVVVLQPVLASPPPPWTVAYRSHRWRKMLARLAEAKYSRLRPAYAAYITSQWNTIAPTKGKQVQALEMRCVRRKIDVAHRNEAVAASSFGVSAEAGIDKVRAGAPVPLSEAGVETEAGSGERGRDTVSNSPRRSSNKRKDSASASDEKQVLLWRCGTGFDGQSLLLPEHTRSKKQV